MIRRAIAKRPHEAHLYKEMIQFHCQQGTRGATYGSDTTAQANGSLTDLSPAPHPTRGKRKDWLPEKNPTDPIRYLLADLVTMGAKLTTNLQILTSNEPPIDIVATPYQYLYRSVLEAAARARTKASEGTKVLNCTLSEIDTTATTHSHNKLGEKDMVYIQTHQYGGGWNKDKLKEIGAIYDGMCDLCGEHHHLCDMIWSCSHPEVIKCRQQADPDLAAIDHKLIPDTIKRGIAPAMRHNHEQTYWGQSMDKTNVLTEKNAELIGIKPPPFQNEEASAILTQANRIKVNARQLIATLRGGHGMGQNPDYPEDIKR